MSLTELDTRLRDQARLLVSNHPDTTAAEWDGGDAIGKFTRRNLEGTVTGISGVTPVFIAATADVTTLDVEDRVVINDQAWLVKEKSRKGSGVTVIMLEDLDA